MAKRRLRLLGGLVVLALAACEYEPRSKMSADPVQLMADLHCEAVSLRKARFELADEMRFMEDTLINPSITDSTKEVLEGKLAHLEPYKDSIVTRSLNLAKIIKFKLDSLMELEFTQQIQRDEFDARLTDELEKRGCK